MARLDIRKEAEEIEEIIFADGNSFDYSADRLKRSSDKEIFYIVADDESSINVYYKDVQNLIKALQKAVELGWTK